MGLSLEFGLGPTGPQITEVWRAPYLVLAVAMGVVGGYTSSMIMEVLMHKRHQFLSSAEKREGIGAFGDKALTHISIFAAGTTFGVSAIWILHFAAMAAVSYEKELRLNVWYTVVSLVCSILGSYGALEILWAGHDGELRNSVPNHAQLLAAGYNLRELQAVADEGNIKLDRWLEFKQFCFRWRAAFAALSLSLGIGGTHYIGVLAARMQARLVINYVVVLTSVVAVILGTFFMLFALYRLHGWRWRFASALITALLVLCVHLYGYKPAFKFMELQPGEASNVDGEGELLMTPKRAIVVASVSISVFRFLAIGVVASP